MLRVGAMSELPWIDLREHARMINDALAEACKNDAYAVAIASLSNYELRLALSLHHDLDEEDWDGNWTRDHVWFSDGPGQ